MASVTPVPLPVLPKPSKGNALGIASLVVAGIGILPILANRFNALEARFHGMSFRHVVSTRLRAKNV